jgi:hypothetical protein
MKSIIFVLLFSSLALAKFPHDVLLECTSKMQRLGFSKENADGSCSISAGESCTELQSQVIQRVYPDCVGELLYMRVKPVEFAMQFCNLAAHRSPTCSPQKYIVERELFVACVYHGKRRGEMGDVLNRCLEKVLLYR